MARGFRRLLGVGAATLRRNAHALVLVSRHPGVSLPVKLLIGLVLLYALSPIDLIPDFIPVLGWIDDLVIVPFGLWLVTRVIPAEIWRDCQARARQQRRTGSRLLVIAFAVFWIGIAALVTLAVIYVV